ncbi:carboxypeptidase-like regulatory domain-containing protein [Blastopirellula sp. J2-11]|uniref:carboxypeptidase-like regulatory domain-containing protein n=1 Tax=Blastopirellula sp. J2-11 TaxID=2943192 RepID=UPI0021C92BC0|nr:carboxypeptidase-like regulatory domain-containing protein [Blastopirellula sp. J2-11]UUO04682.1 carboxypeptidase-like regulatory domain-containing protein [Blastopirellula sp. J2-11]
MFHRTIGFILCITWLVAAAGCTKHEDKWTAMRPQVFKTQGVIRMDGQPLPGATVVFESSTGNHSGTAVTDDSGKYQLTTFEDFDGVTAGEFLISIEKNDWIEVGPETGEAVDGGTYRRPLEKVPLTPAKYRDFEKSELTAIVTPDGPNRFDFDIQSDAK